MRSSRRHQHSLPGARYRGIPTPVALIVLVILIVAMLMTASGCGSRKEGDVTIRVSTGASTADIARMLVDEDVIDNERDFTSKANAAGIDQKLEAGTYRFTRGEPLDNILYILENGLQSPEGVVTVPEGYSLADIANLVAGKATITHDAYVGAAVPKGRILPLKGAGGAADLEGFLFPSTYNLDPETDARTLVDKQLETFKDKTAGLDWEAAGRLGLTEYEALTVASMVEREARVPEERPLVAAVIYNRLAAGMKLEIDATVQYALGYWKTDLTAQDLETPSAYNTRLYGGLPPGPICNPGLASIDAALHPANVDYLYYVATGDAAGHHTFTASYQEFLQASAARP